MDPRNIVCMSSLVVFFSAYQAYLEGKENCVTFIFIYELSLLLPWSGSTLCFLIPDVASAFMGVWRKKVGRLRNWKSKKTRKSKEE